MADYLALLFFVIIMVATPGPANLLLMAAGARFGYMRSVAFLLGVTGGKLLLNLGLGFGAFSVLEAHPLFFASLKYLSVVYMIWLSYRMARQPFAVAPESLATPPRFMSGVLVHPLNPKAWAMTLIAWSDYGHQIDDALVRIGVISGTFLFVQLFAHSFWCYGGVRLMGLVQSDRVKTQIQRGLALLTVVIVVYIAL